MASMSSIFDVTARYRVDDRASGPLARIAASADSLAAKAERARATLGMVGTLLIGGGVTALGIGLGLAARRMATLTKRGKEAQISIAGVFSTLGDKSNSWADNLDRAAGLLAKFRKASITSPASGAQFRQIFQNAAPGLVPLQLNDRQITQFMSRSVAAGLAFNGGDYQQTGRDITQILQGRAGADVKTYANLRNAILSNAGVRGTQQLNQLAKSHPERVFQALSKAMAGLDDANKTYARSLTGLLGSLGEFRDRFLRAVGGPVFDVVKRHLASAVDWLGKNQQKVRSLAQQIGSALGGALDKAVGGARALASHFHEVVAVVGTLATLKGLRMLTDFGALGVQTLATLRGSALGRVGAAATSAAPGILSSVGGAGKGAWSWLRSKGAGGALKSAAGAPLSLLGDLLFTNMLDSASGSKAVGGVGKSIARGAGGLFDFGNSPVLGVLPEIAPEIGAIAAALAPLAALAAAVAGAFLDMQDPMDRAATTLKATFSGLMKDLDRLAVRLGFNGGIGQMFKALLRVLGHGLLDTISVLVTMVEILVEQLNNAFEPIAKFTLTLAELNYQFKTKGITGLSWSAASQQANHLYASLYSKSRMAQIEKQVQHLADQRKKKNKPGKGGGGKPPPPQVHVKIEQHIKRETNPDRIAISTVDLLKKTYENTRVSSMELKKR